MTLLDFRLSHRVVLLFATLSVVTINAFGAMVSGAKYLRVSFHGQTYWAAGLTTKHPTFSTQNTFRPMAVSQNEEIADSSARVATRYAIEEFTQPPKNLPKRPRGRVHRIDRRTTMKIGNGAAVLGHPGEQPRTPTWET